MGPWPSTDSLTVDFLTTSIKSFCEQYSLCECVYMCLGHCQGTHLNYSWPVALLGFNNSSISQSLTQTQRQTPRTNVQSDDLRKIRDTHHLISHCLRASSVWDGASETQDTHGLHLHKHGTFTTTHSLTLTPAHNQPRLTAALMFYIIAVILLMCRHFFRWLYSSSR